ncbi:hypothetical protein [Caballeronia sp. LZ035]|uniref:hypothetical protein n=1 Tax=Caballeronia sp. LZ035 TaxID=3038568 RepID=UPI00285C368A|nr:hypothetical protein [Caballeronia sp. LZ035]MDR5757180.1 hypothetical protein [Caballeronia sp. LZ035]
MSADSSLLRRIALKRCERIIKQFSVPNHACNYAFSEPAPEQAVCACALNARNALNVMAQSGAGRDGSASGALAISTAAARKGEQVGDG